MHPDRARGGKLRELCRRIKDSADAQALIHTAVYAVLARRICLRRRGAFASYVISVNAPVDRPLAGSGVVQKEVVTP
jgi:hypothetical protein